MTCHRQTPTRDFALARRKPSGLVLRCRRDFPVVSSCQKDPRSENLHILKARYPNIPHADTKFPTSDKSHGCPFFGTSHLNLISRSLPTLSIQRRSPYIQHPDIACPSTLDALDSVPAPSRHAGAAISVPAPSRQMRRCRNLGSCTIRHAGAQSRCLRHPDRCAGAPISVPAPSQQMRRCRNHLTPRRYPTLRNSPKLPAPAQNQTHAPNPRARPMRQTHAPDQCIRPMHQSRSPAPASDRTIM